MELETNHYQLARHYQSKSFPLHPPGTGPLVCHSAGGTKTMHGECTAGVRYTRTKVVCSVWRPVHFHSNMKCTHKSQKVHGKLSQERNNYMIGYVK